MTLRRRLAISGLTISAVLICAATWQVRLYLKARDQVSSSGVNLRPLAIAGNHLMDSLLVSLTIDFTLLIAAWIVLKRSVVNPLTSLSEQLGDVASGSLHAQIAIDSPVEMNKVAHDAELMRRSLVRHIDETKAAYQTLDSEAPVSLALRNALRATVPDVSQLDVSGHVDSVESLISGDWWDCVRVPNATALVLVDVAGHGAAAGVVGLQIKAVINAGLSAGIPAENIFERVSQDLGDIHARAASAVVVIVPDNTSDPILVTNAGHPAVLIAQPDGYVEHVEATGPLLVGLSGSWSTRAIECPVGSTIALFSDGLIETHDEAGEPYGMLPIVDHMRTAATSESAAELCMQLVHSARQFSSSWNRDDVTLVIARRL